MTGQSLPVTKRSKTVAAVFALFLGGFGIHKFYLGRPGWGCVMLFTFWLLVPFLIGFIHALELFSMSEAEFQAKWHD